MFAIVVNEKGGEQKRLEFDKPEVTIGRVQGNDIILPKGNVSKRHSRIVLKDGKFIIVDLKSTNGTYVNGRKITSPLVVKGTDKIYIGDFILSVEELQGAGAEEAPPPAPNPRKSTASIPPPPPPRRTPVAVPAEPPSSLDGHALDSNGGGPRDLPAASDPGVPERPSRPSQPVMPSPLPPPPRVASNPSPSASAASLRVTAERASPLTEPRLPPVPEPRERNPASSPSMPASKPMPVAEKPARPTLPSPPQPTSTRPSTPAQREALIPTRDVARPAPRPPRSLPGVAGSPQASAVAEAMSEVLRRVHDEMGDALDEAQSAEAQSELRDRVERQAAEWLADGETPAPAAEIAKDVAAELFGHGLFDSWLADEIHRAVVVRFDRIFVDEGEGLGEWPRAFSSALALERSLERLAALRGAESAFATARAGGTLSLWFNDVEIQAVWPKSGSLTVTVQRHPALRQRLPELVTDGVLTKQAADVLLFCLDQGHNLVVAGGDENARLPLFAALAAHCSGNSLVAVVGRGWGQSGAQFGLGSHPSALAEAQLLGADRVVVESATTHVSALFEAWAGGERGLVCGIAAQTSREGIDRLVAARRMAKHSPDLNLLEETLSKAVAVVVVVGADGQVASLTDGTLRPIFARGSDGRLTATGTVPAWAGDAPEQLFAP